MRITQKYLNLRCYGHKNGNLSRGHTMNTLRIKSHVATLSLAKAFSNYIVSLWTTEKKQATTENNSISGKARQLGCDMSQFDLVS